MSSNGFVDTIHLSAKPSRLLAIYLLVIHLLAILALLQPLAMPLSLRISVFVLVFASAVYQQWRFRKRVSMEVEHWIWNAQGNWRNSANSSVYTLSRRGSVNTPWFVVLPLRDDKGSDFRRLLLCRDQLDANTFRRLRVRLRFVQDVASARRVATL